MDHVFITHNGSLGYILAIANLTATNMGYLLAILTLFTFNIQPVIG